MNPYAFKGIYFVYHNYTTRAIKKYIKLTIKLYRWTKNTMKKIAIIEKTVSKRIPFLQGISLINWCFCFHKCKLQNMVTSIFNNRHDLVRICYGIQETHFTNSWTIFFIWCFYKLKNMLWLTKREMQQTVFHLGYTHQISYRGQNKPPWNVITWHKIILKYYHITNNT